MALSNILPLPLPEPDDAIAKVYQELKELAQGEPGVLITGLPKDLGKSHLTAPELHMRKAERRDKPAPFSDLYLGHWPADTLTSTVAGPTEEPLTVEKIKVLKDRIAGAKAGIIAIDEFDAMRASKVAAELDAKIHEAFSKALSDQLNPPITPAPKDADLTHLPNFGRFE